MSKTYLVRWKALEAYFFAGERNFGFGAGRNYNGNPYYIHSLKTPSQTTLLGTLRYEILRRLNKETDYGKAVDKNLKDEQKKLAGDSSFDLSNDKIQQFGIIKKLSPLFIMKGNQVIIKAPYHKHFEEKGYVARDLKEGESFALVDGKNQRVLSLLEKIDLKEESDHRSKYCILNADKVELIDSDELFIPEVRVGINKKATKDGFFKKEYIRMKSEYEFAAYVELDDLNGLEDILKKSSQSIVYMGMSKSAFLMIFEKVDEDALCNNVANALYEKDTNGIIYYAVSDLYVDYEKISQYCSLILGDTREFRNLITKDAPENYYNRFNASALHYMINAGSVFFVRKEFENDFNTEVNNIKLQNIGLNKVVKIGGN